MTAFDTSFYSNLRDFILTSNQANATDFFEMLPVILQYPTWASFRLSQFLLISYQIEMYCLFTALVEPIHPAWHFGYLSPKWNRNKTCHQNLLHRLPIPTAALYVLLSFKNDRNDSLRGTRKKENKNKLVLFSFFLVSHLNLKLRREIGFACQWCIRKPDDS